MAHIVHGAAQCNRAGCNKTWHRDPAITVLCPACGAPAGVRCRRPNGHSGPCIELHAERDLLADRKGRYGPCPFGICGAANRPEQGSLPLFD